MRRVLNLKEINIKDSAAPYINKINKANSGRAPRIARAKSKYLANSTKVAVRSLPRKPPQTL